MLIDLFLVCGGLYVAYTIVMSILNNSDAWITYKPKHKKSNRLTRLLEEEN